MFPVIWGQFTQTFYTKLQSYTKCLKYLPLAKNKIFWVCYSDWKWLMVWRNMNHLKHFEANYTWIYKALRNKWVQKAPLISDSSLTKSIYKRNINIHSSYHTWKDFFSSLPSFELHLILFSIMKWESVVILISLLTWIHSGVCMGNPSFSSILPQHLQQQIIFVQSNDNFHNVLLAICINFQWHWREGWKTGTTILEKGKDSM